jgi:dihydrofolate reductase
MNLIVAFNRKNVIGLNNTIPWHIPEDLKEFKRLTNNQIIVMGRKTFDSLPNGPLKNRIHVIITNQTKYYERNNEILYYCNFEQSFSLLNKLKDETQKQVFIIGGSQIYRQFFEYCTKFYITIVENNKNGDTFFPFDISIFNQECFKKEKDIILLSKKQYNLSTY